MNEDELEYTEIPERKEIVLKIPLSQLIGWLLIVACLVWASIESGWPLAKWVLILVAILLPIFYCICKAFQFLGSRFPSEKDEDGEEEIEDLS